MSAVSRERAAEYGPAAPTPNEVTDAAPEPTEVRLVGVDAQVISPAWELELLVTGIVLVGLFQIPPALHEVWRHWEPHFPLVLAATGRTILQAANAALYALIICFTIALALRGYWVALVGVNSVFPHGVRWDKQREYGPIQAELIRGRVRPLPTFIGRANDVASLVFATGFVFAASTVASIGFLIVLLALFGVLTALLPLKTAALAFAAAFVPVMLIVLAVPVIDMRRGAKLAPGGWAERFVRAALRVMSGLTPAGVRSLGAVLTSNVSKRVAYTALGLGISAAYLTAFESMSDGGDLPGGSSYAFFAEDRRPAAVTADLYDSLRGADASPTLPSIQSDVIADPYVRLFVPYRPDRHNVALRRACPGLRQPLGAKDPGAAAADDAVLACAARVHAVALDGRPVPGGRFRYFTNPRTERRGFLMLIPAANLAAGEHLIALQPARLDPSPADTVPIRIPFWR